MWDCLVEGLNWVTTVFLALLGEVTDKHLSIINSAATIHVHFLHAENAERELETRGNEGIRQTEVRD